LDAGIGDRNHREFLDDSVFPTILAIIQCRDVMTVWRQFLC
jgi:hypothetical protein